MALLLAGPLPAVAELRKGHDWLGLQHRRFPVREAVRHLEPGAITGSLDRTFGSSFTHILYLLNHSTISGHRVHFVNGSCIRLRRCQPHELGHGMTSHTFSKAVIRGSRRLLTPYRKAIKGYCEAFEGRGVVLYGSPVLEHAMDKYAIRRLIDEMLDVCPEIRPVNSPVDGWKAERYRGALIERHLPQYWSRADIISTDGLDSKYVPSRLPARTKIILGWTPRYNLIAPGKFTPPLKRKRKPSSSRFKSVARSLRDFYK